MSKCEHPWERPTMVVSFMLTWPIQKKTPRQITNELSLVCGLTAVTRRVRKNCISSCNRFTQKHNNGVVLVVSSATQGAKQHQL